MTDDTTKPLTRQAIGVRDRSLPGKVTGRLRKAIEAMVWSGARRKAAAEGAGMTDHSLRAALRKPHVIGHYQGELRILRESERARTFHRLTELRDQDSNKNAAVAAARTLEQVTDDEATRGAGGRAVTPGLVIVINTPGGQSRTIGPLVPPAIAINPQGDPIDDE